MFIFIQNINLYKEFTDLYFVKNWLYGHSEGHKSINLLNNLRKELNS